MQSKEQTLPSTGSKFIPSETPNLLLWTGPNTILSKSMVDMIITLDFMGYKSSNNPLAYTLKPPKLKLPSHQNIQICFIRTFYQLHISSYFIPVKVMYPTQFCR